MRLGALGLVLTLGAGLVAAPLAVEAQQAGKVPRIGWLLTGSLESPETRVILDAFRQGLRERGYVEGQNIIIEYRFAEGRFDRLPDLATELARLKVDLIVAGATPAARAAQQATTTIPIVSF
ncbi:MAG: ABC transporter substrate binding protein, partial [Candidatus Rokuibacteriota bacterium]